MDDREVGRFWNENAETWAKLARAGFDVYRDRLNTPAFLAMLPDVRDLHGLDVKCTDGIVAGSPEETMRNVGQLCTQGMIETDRTILRIMIQKGFDA
jgi:hypothetical protein